VNAATSMPPHAARGGLATSPSAPGRLVLLALVNVLGVVAFLWPFALPAMAGGDAIHQSDAPLVLAAALACLGALLFLELGRGGMGPKVVSIVGVLGAAMVALRLPGFVAGFSAMFIVVLVAGAAFGPAFGFLLGAVGTFASGMFVGGLGPWLPFQMVAIGWVGAGAGLLPRPRDPRARVAWLAAYGFVAGYAFGAVINLWSWPFIAGGSKLGWIPSAGVASNVRRYVAYYAATSFAWDTFRAVGNAVMVVTLGRPLLAALDRAARRMHLSTPAPTVSPSAAEEPAVGAARRAADDEGGSGRALSAAR
jgi:energy-coupling factor transport system substrate-specific component